MIAVFIYVHPRDWYLLVFPGKDAIEYQPDAEIDVGGWDIRKVMIQHLVKSNAVMLEWLSSGVVYRMDRRVRDELWALGEAFFNPIIPNFTCTLLKLQQILLPQQ